MMHTTADDPGRYRSEEDVERWKKRDPLPRYQNYLEQKNILPEERLAELEEAIQQQIQTAIDNAESKMAELGDPLGMFAHLYAELPPHLKKQKEELIRELDTRKGGGSDG